MPTASDSTYPKGPDPRRFVVNEQGMEDAFVGKLQGLKYTYRHDITDRSTLEQNFREKFESLNRVRLTEADREMPSDEMRTTNRVAPTSTFEIDALRFPPGSFQSSVSLRSAHPSNFASLPGQLFYSTQIPACLWFLAKNRTADAKRGVRDRRHLINAGLAKA